MSVYVRPELNFEYFYVQKCFLLSLIYGIVINFIISSQENIRKFDCSEGWEYCVYSAYNNCLYLKFNINFSLNFAQSKIFYVQVVITNNYK